MANEIMTRESIKACPFCGSKNIDLHLSFDQHDRKPTDQAWHWIITCTSCNATMKYPTAAKAMEAWNRRTEQ